MGEQTQGYYTVAGIETPFKPKAGAFSKIIRSIRHLCQTHAEQGLNDRTAD